jgi:hypothetical protein
VTDCWYARRRDCGVCVCVCVRVCVRVSVCVCVHVWLCVKNISAELTTLRVCMCRSV